MFLKLYWKLTGWKVSGNLPGQVKKMVIVVAPHTSWVDLFVGLAARNELQIRHSAFLGKKELFVGPLGWLLRKMGGTPVDRFSHHGVVDQVADLFAANEEFVLAMAPEGTRKRVDKLRTGFYHIAKKAGVPILPAGLDYEHKQILIGEPLYAGDDEEADLRKIIGFFSGIKGRKPSSDLRHLKDA